MCYDCVADRFERYEHTLALAAGRMKTAEAGDRYGHNTIKSKRKNIYANVNYVKVDLNKMLTGSIIQNGDVLKNVVTHNTRIPIRL